ncbi:extracellular solute-binding protein [Cohnella sp. GCM10012308]|uniref:extracellular solute-binding protein n=1 Tax=Cohnella sp. GCM10012308 TaxID=3317329 RepID=UPI00360B6439
MKRYRGSKQKGAAMLTMSLAFGMLAACGSNNGDDPAAQPTDQSSASAPAATNSTAPSKEAAIVEIKVWDKPAPDASNKAVTEELQAKFDDAHPNIKVIHEDETQTSEKFLAAVAGGEQPEVFRPSFPKMQEYVQAGIVADITDLVSASPDKDRFIDGAFNMATRDGKIYGVPFTMYSTGVYYNKKLFANAGIASLPTTWDEFAATAKTVQEKNPGTVGFDILGMDWGDWHFEYYVWQAGGDLTELQPDGTVKLAFTSEAAVKALQYYKDLKWTHQVVQSNVLQSYEENNKDFYSGKSAMILGASDAYNAFVSQGMDPNEIGFMPYPVGPAGVGPSQVGGSFWAISPSASPEKRQAAFEYIMFMSSKETIESRLQFNKDNGLGVNPFTVVKDVDPTNYIEGMPTDFLSAIRKAAETQQLEYYLKSSLSPYVVKPIQKILLDKNADPLTELKAAEQLAQKEVIDKYNKDILSKSSK